MLEQIREALETGLELARQEAAIIHETYAGYKPDKHSAVDEDVKQIEDAIAALAAMADVSQPIRQISDKGQNLWTDLKGDYKLSSDVFDIRTLYTHPQATSEAEAMLAHVLEHGKPGLYQDGYGYPGKGLYATGECKKYPTAHDAIRAAMKGAGS